MMVHHGNIQSIQGQPHGTFRKGRCGWGRAIIRDGKAAAAGRSRLPSLIIQPGAVMAANLLTGLPSPSPLTYTSEMSFVFQSTPHALLHPFVQVHIFRSNNQRNPIIFDLPIGSRNRSQTTLPEVVS